MFFTHSMVFKKMIISLSPDLILIRNFSIHNCLFMHPLNVFGPLCVSLKTEKLLEKYLFMIVK